MIHRIWFLTQTLLFSLIVGNLMYGQTYNVYFKGFDHLSLNNGARGLVETSGGNLLISGTSHGISFDMQYYLLDRMGDTIWKKHYDFSESMEMGRVVLKTTSSYYAIGRIYDSMQLSSKVMVLKLNKYVDFKTLKSIRVGREATVYGATLRNNHIYAAGHNFDSVTGYNDLFLLKADTAGNKVWAFEYDFSTIEETTSLDTTPDGGFLIGGEWINPATQNWDLFLLKLDSAGNTQWHKSYRTTNDERYGYATTTLDGGYAIAGYRETNGQPDGLLIKTDSNGVFQWEKLYGKPQQIDLFKILRQDAKGNFILAGNSRDPNAPNTPRAWLMKTNSNGDTLWTRLYSYYGGDSHTYVEDMIQTSDGGYALTGYTIANVPTGNDLWVLKTDSLGRTCDSPPCHGVITGFQTPAVQTNSIRVYPNPSEGMLTVDFPAPVPGGSSLVFYNLQGVAVRELTLIPGQTNQAVRLDLPPGLYLYRTQSNTGPIYSGKVVVK